MKATKNFKASNLEGTFNKVGSTYDVWHKSTILGTVSKQGKVWVGVVTNFGLNHVHEHLGKCFTTNHTVKLEGTFKTRLEAGQAVLTQGAEAFAHHMQAPVRASSWGWFWASRINNTFTLTFNQRHQLWQVNSNGRDVVACGTCKDTLTKLMNSNDQGVDRFGKPDAGLDRNIIINSLIGYHFPEADTDQIKASLTMKQAA